MLTQEAIAALLKNMREELTLIAKDGFVKTGFAPRLAIYLPRDTYTQLVEGCYLTSFGRMAGVTRELISDGTILGYPLIMTEEQEDILPSYTICQVHYATKRD